MAFIIKNTFQQVGGVSIPPYGIQLSFHFRQGLNSFSKPFSLVNKPYLLIVSKHILICQIKKGKSSFVPTFPSCSTLLLFPFTVKCLKMVIYTILYFNFNSLFNPVASNPSPAVITAKNFLHVHIDCSLCI